MPRNPTTGDFVRVSNTFSEPIYGTVIDPTDANSLFDDYDVGLTFDDSSPLILIGSTSGVTTIKAADTASGTLTLPAGTTDFSATGGAGQFVRQESAGAPFTVTTVPASAIASGAALTRVDDTNVTLTLGGAPTTALLAATSITAGWTGTLAAGRLNGNVVQAITNDTNVTGSITAQNLTLGWTGQLSPTRGGTGSNLSATGGTGQVLKQSTVGGNVTVGTIPASEIASGAALTRVSDTNVTLTLGGTPTTALLAAASITAGWSGTLAVSRGGTNLASGTSGGILGFTASGTLASSAALAANGVVIGGGAGATPTAITAGTNGQLLLGVTSSAPAMATMSGGATITNAGVVTLAQIPNTSGSPSASFGAVKVDGTTITATSGVLTAIGGIATDITVGSTTVSGGTTTRVLYDNAGVLGEYSSVPVAVGGTGVSSLTAYAVLCGGTTSTGAVQSIASVGTAGQVLGSNGAGALPTMQSLQDTIEFVIDGGGTTITTGVKGDLEIPYGCTITRATMLADQSGSIVVNLWVDTYANYPPTVADKITASAPPTISTATKSQDSTLTGWTTALASGSTIRYNVDSVTTITRVTVSLKVTRTSIS